MQTVVNTNDTLLASLMLSTPAEQPLAVVDERATKRDVQHAYDIAATLDRRIDLIFTGKGRHIDGIPSVRFAKTVRVGDGKPGALITNMMMRAVLIASPAAVAMITGFGAAAASDLAIMIAGLAPLTLIPTAAIRSFRADRVAAAERAKAAPLRASEADVAAIESFVKKVSEGASPLTLACVRQTLAIWIDKGTTDNVLTRTGINRLAELHDAIPAPSADMDATIKRLFATRELVAETSEQHKLGKQDLAELEVAFGSINVLEREALSSRWREKLGTDALRGSRLFRDVDKLLPASTTSDTSVKPGVPVVFASSKAST